MQLDAAEIILAHKRNEVGDGPRRVQHGQLDLDDPLAGVDIRLRRKFRRDHRVDRGQLRSARRRRPHCRDVGGGIELTKILGRAHADRPVAIREGGRQERPRSGRIERRERVERVGARDVEAVPLCGLERLGQRGGGIRRLDRREPAGGGATHDRVVGLEVRRQDLRRVGRADLRERVEHRGDDALIRVAQHHRQRTLRALAAKVAQGRGERGAHRPVRVWIERGDRADEGVDVRLRQRVERRGPDRRPLRRHEVDQQLHRGRIA